MNIFDIFVRRPVLSSVVSLLILLVGLQAVFTLQIRQYPEIEESVITITTAYPGADAELIQGFITQPIAQAVISTEGLDYVTSTSTLGTSTVSLHMQLGTNSDVALTQALAKVQQVRSELPEEAEDPVLVKGTGESFALLYIAFRSEDMSAEEVTDYLSRVVQSRFATIDGVSEAQILGEHKFAMRVWIDPIRLAAQGVTAAEVAEAIQANNYQAAPGRTTGEMVAIPVKVSTTLQTPEQFGELVIREVDGTLVRLKDVARVELGAEDTNTKVMFNGEEATFMAITATPSANPLDTIDAVRATMPDIQRQLPPGMSAEVVYDATEAISDSIEEVLKTIAEAVVIVLIVILLFLGSFRSVIIPVVTIPLSLVGVCFVLQLLGYSINLLTLLAMVLAIGLVVDDAIVVVENVHRHIEEGMRPFQAALKSLREITGAVIAMTITLAAVYAPIGFTGGLTGALFQEFAFTLAGAVIISGIVALTLSPMMASRLLPPMDEGVGRFQQFVDNFFTRLQGWYERRLHNTLNYRPVTALIAVVMLLSCGYLFLNTQKELAPGEDEGVVFSFITGPQYANIDYTNLYMDEVVEAFASIPEHDVSFSISGIDGLNSGVAGLGLVPWSERDRSAEEISGELGQLLNGIAGVQAFAFVPSTMPGAGGGAPVQFVIKSPRDPEAVAEVAEAVANEARQTGRFIFVNTTLKFNNPQLNIDVDRDKAAALGITMADIGRTLGVLLSEGQVSRFEVEGRSYEVIPQVARQDRLNPGDLNTFYLRTGEGDLVPLSTVISFDTSAVPNKLTQMNQMNTSTIQAVPMPGVTLGDALTILQEAANRTMPEGFSYDYEGQLRQLVTEGNTIMIAFGFAIIVIFLVLAAQFESFRDPIIVLVSVPMSICGALIPLNLGLATINIYTQVGLITLIGLISKHGILMVDFANKMQVDGMSKREAIEHAAGVRLRPILMTTAAMVLGVAPLLVATGPGAAARFSIGLVIAAGMTIGTLFTLFVVPMVYTFLATDKRAEAGATEAAPVMAGD